MYIPIKKMYQPKRKKEMQEEQNINWIDGYDAAILNLQLLGYEISKLRKRKVSFHIYDKFSQKIRETKLNVNIDVSKIVKKPIIVKNK